MLLRLKYEARDFAKHTRAVRHAVGRVAAARLAVEARQRGEQDVQVCERAMYAARMSYPLAPGGALERRLSDIMSRVDVRPEDWDRVAPGSDKRVVDQGIILKAPVWATPDDARPGGRGHVEKGALYAAFEYQWARIFRHGDVAALARDYHLVLGTTWSPPYDWGLAIVARYWKGSRALAVLNNLDDVEPIRRLHPVFVPTPLLMSSWVDPELFALEPAVVEKEWDLVVVSNFSPYKRHHALFAGLAAAPRKLRVLLVGVEWLGVTADVLRQLAGEYGVADQITIRVNPSDADLRHAVRSARAAAILSLNEGSCVAAAECLMLDTPLGMFDDAHVGSVAFVNEHTGRRLRGGRALGEDLVRLVDGAAGQRPRAWMLANGVHARGSSEVLDRVAREAALAAGERWTQGLAPHRLVRFVPQYLDDADAERLSPHYATFEARYGIALREPPRR